MKKKDISKLIREHGDGVSGIILNMVKNNLCATLSFKDAYSQYAKMNDLLYELDPDKYNKCRRPGTASYYHELLPGTFYIIPINRANFILVYQSSELVLLRGDVVSELTLIFVGRDCFKYRGKFIKKINSRDHDTISVHIAYEGIHTNIDVCIHTFDDIILTPKVRSDIIDGLLNWKEDRPWYVKHGITHKIGVLLYGDPGSGKSSVIKAISHMFNNCPICTIQQSRVYRAVDDIIDLKRGTLGDGVFIVVLEDFDLLFDGSRAKPDKDTDAGQVDWHSSINKNDNLQMLFQMLDGLWSMDNIIFIATTNHYENLDPALVRSGRFDIQAEIDWFDRDRAIEFCKMFEMSEEWLDEQEVQYPIQPSLLQSKIMAYRASEQRKRREIHTTVEHLKHLENTGKLENES